MKKCFIYKFIGIAILLFGAIDMPICDSFQDESNEVQYAGINGKHLQKGAEYAKKGWKWFKGCSGRKIEVPLNGQVTNKTLDSRLIYTTETLIKGINEVKSQEEVLPKIGEYLSQTKPNEGGTKVINCVRTEANQIKMYLYEQGKNVPTKERVIKIASESINLAEYDIRAMQENYYIGNDGIEYVEFIIPKRPQNILKGEYNGRLYECMVFNIPKDINGNWERFKEYLIAFINDLMNRPFQLWDEYMFRRGLAELQIDGRDITEIERYLFANSNNLNNEKYFSKYIPSKTA